MMNTRSRSFPRLAAAALVACFVLARPSVPLAQRAPAPKLVVVLVVDQMRVDYLQRYAPLFSAGLKRLSTDGAWFVNAAYPYLNTITCVGHSTIGTGTLPYHHGMISNGWLDRNVRKTPECTDDPSAREISYVGLKPRTSDSARNLRRPSLGEQIRKNGRGRAVAMSLKPRSSITLVGHKADAVVWFDDRGGWSTSSAFTDEPIPFLQEFINAHPITADRDKVWTKTLDESAYFGKDDVPGERPPIGTTRTFPHVLDVPAQNGMTETFFTRWTRSPFADEYLERMAEASIDALSLGKGTGTDYLAVSFSSLDVVGHVFGPQSHEVQDLLVRLDRTIGRLLDALDQKVGRGNYVLGLSADHGVAEVPEETGVGGRLSAKEVKETLEKALSPILGGGDLVLASSGADIYLSTRTQRRLRVDSAARKTAMDALLALPSVSRVFLGTDLASDDARRSTDPVMKAAALSYYPGRSGDLIIVPNENWILSTSVTSHGSMYPYDKRVPVILFGAGVTPGRYEQAATPADLAPSLAAIAGIKIEETDGHPLSEAFSK